MSQTASPKVAESGSVSRQIHLPFSKAVEISIKSIRIRFARSLITAAGIFLGIAFFSSVRVSLLVSQMEATTAKAHLQVAQQGAAMDINADAPVSTGTSDEDAARARLQWLSIMALVVCTVGITNAMLMSVSERYKEIGTMKCLGALDSFIVKLFFIEGCLMGFLASLAGFVAGWLLVSLLHIFSGAGALFTAQFAVASLKQLVTSVALGTGLTFIATIAPARNAARMPPAAALRVEI